VTLGSRREVDYNWALRSYDATSSNSLPTFRDNLSVPSSRVRNEKNFLALKDETIGCLATSVRNCQYSLPNNPEERSLYSIYLRSVKYYRFTFAWAFETIPFLQVSPPKFCTRFSSPLYVPHYPFLLSSLTGEHILPLFIMQFSLASCDSYLDPNVFLCPRCFFFHVKDEVPQLYKITLNTRTCMYVCVRARALVCTCVCVCTPRIDYIICCNEQ
jgi:hypothetical protein